MSPAYPYPYPILEDADRVLDLPEIEAHGGTIRHRVDKRTHHIKFEQEDENMVTIVIEPKSDLKARAAS